MAERIGSELGNDWEDLGMTTPRDWPNNAAEARDRAAEYSVEAQRELRPIIAGVHLTDEDKMRRVGLVMANLLEITRMLEAVGAKTSPLNDHWGRQV